MIVPRRSIGQKPVIHLFDILVIRHAARLLYEMKEELASLRAVWLLVLMENKTLVTSLSLGFHPVETTRRSLRYRLGRDSHCVATGSRQNRL